MDCKGASYGREIHLRLFGGGGAEDKTPKKRYSRADDGVSKARPYELTN